jgi:hypothetical protein
MEYSMEAAFLLLVLMFIGTGFVYGYHAAVRSRRNYFIVR